MVVSPPVVVNGNVEIQGMVLLNVHRPEACSGRPCVIHAPTDHKMITWPAQFSMDKGVVERVCEHGCGHPDPDQRAYFKSVNSLSAMVHACDGCCG